MNGNELKHYGVLGMKWGVRRYQNKDGSLTPAGIKRYGRGGTPKYTSWSTKRRQTAARSDREDARISREQGFEDEARYFERSAKREQTRAKASQKFDDAYTNYAKKTSIGKAIAGNILLGPFGYKTYAMARTAGESRGKAAVRAMFDIGFGIIGPLGVSVQRHNIRENYIDNETRTKNGRNSRPASGVRKDLRDMSDQEFMNRYSASKEKVRLRIERYGDPANSPLTKIGTSKAVKGVYDEMTNLQSRVNKPAKQGASNRPRRTSNSPSMNVKALLNGYKPKNGSPNSLFDIDDWDLIDLNIDDPDFRKEYGVSEADYKRYLNASRKD